EPSQPSLLPPPAPANQILLGGLTNHRRDRNAVLRRHARKLIDLGAFEVHRVAARILKLGLPACALSGSAPSSLLSASGHAMILSDPNLNYNDLNHGFRLEP